MKLKLAIPVVTAVALVAAPAAVGKPTKLEGKVKNDANSIVKVKSQLNGQGEVKKLKGLNFLDVDFVCDTNTTGDKSFKLGGFKVTKGFVPDVIPPKVQYSFGGTKTVGVGSYRVVGTTNRTGTKVKASLDFSFKEHPNDNESDAYCYDRGDGESVSWKAKQK